MPKESHLNRKVNRHGKCCVKKSHNCIIFEGFTLGPITAHSGQKAALEHAFDMTVSDSISILRIIPTFVPVAGPNQPPARDRTHRSCGKACRG